MSLDLIWEGVKL